MHAGTIFFNKEAKGDFISFVVIPTTNEMKSPLGNYHPLRME